MKKTAFYRGKKLSNGEWIYGFYMNKDGKHIIVNTTCGNLGMGLEVDGETVGEFTGLMDKHGNKVFEHDIIKYTRKCMYCPEANFHKKDLVSLHTIYWDEKDFSFCQKHYDLESKRIIGGGNITFNDDRAKESEIEVIGNIFDNKLEECELND